MAFSKEQAIIAQNAATAAATLLAGTGATLAEFDEVREHIFRGSIDLAGAETLISGIESKPAARSYGGPRRTSGGSSGGDPRELEVRSGKYAGKTIGEVIDEDVDYAEWFAANGKNEFLSKKFAEALAA